MSKYIKRTSGHFTVPLNNIKASILTYEIGVSSFAEEVMYVHIKKSEARIHLFSGKDYDELSNDDKIQ